MIFLFLFNAESPQKSDQHTHINHNHCLVTMKVIIEYLVGIISLTSRITETICEIIR